MSVWRQAGLAAFVAYFVACASFGADQAANGTPPTSTPEAGLTSGGSPLDASAPDAGEGGGAPPRRWCEQNAPRGATCFDFDGNEAIGAGWSGQETHEGGLLRAEGRAEGDRALRVELLAASSANPRAKLILDLPGATKVALSFDVIVTTAGRRCEGAGCWGSLAQVIDENSRAVIVSIYARDGEAMAQGPLGTAVPLPEFSETRTTRVRLEVGAQSFEVSLDGKPPQLGPPLEDAGAPTRVELGIGQTNGSADAWSVLYDNVVIERL